MKSKDPLANVMIAAPCTVSWDSMIGDDKVRMCGSCQLNVFNTSEMTDVEIIALVSDENACLRIYRRADGTMMTENCPVGLRKIRDGFRRVSKIAAAFWAVVISSSPVFAQGTTTTSKVSADKTTAAAPAAAGADHAAHELYTKAKACLDKKDYKQANAYFKQAQDALAKTKHDPAFEQLVAGEYLKSLQLQDGVAGAAKAREAAKPYDVNILKADPNVIMGRACPTPRPHPTSAKPGAKDNAIKQSSEQK